MAAVLHVPVASAGTPASLQGRGKFGKATDVLPELLLPVLRRAVRREAGVRNLCPNSDNFLFPIFQWDAPNPPLSAAPFPLALSWLGES